MRDFFWILNTLPERGSYSRIGARPYLSSQLIDSRYCPCKGRISWAGLAPQQDSRYEPLTGARFINRLQEVGASPYPKYEPLLGAACAATLAASALKWQQVQSPGRCPGLRTGWSFSPRRAARMSRNRKIRSIRTYGARPVAPAPLKGAHI